MKYSITEIGSQKEEKNFKIYTVAVGLQGGGLEGGIKLRLLVNGFGVRAFCNCVLFADCTLMKSFFVVLLIHYCVVNSGDKVE